MVAQAPLVLDEVLREMVSLMRLSRTERNPMRLDSLINRLQKERIKLTGQAADYVDAVLNMARASVSLLRSVTKGYPEYRSEEARDRSGKWTSSSGSGKTAGLDLVRPVASMLSDGGTPSAPELKQASAGVLQKVRTSVREWFGSLDPATQESIFINVVGTAVLVGLAAYFYFGGRAPVPSDGFDIVNPVLDTLRFIWRHMP
jgi:hypothetical protein